MSDSPLLDSADPPPAPLLDETLLSFSPRQRSPGFLKLSKSSEKAEEDRREGASRGGGGAAEGLTGEKCNSMSWEEKEGRREFELRLCSSPDFWLTFSSLLPRRLSSPLRPSSLLILTSTNSPVLALQTPFG